MGSFRKNPRAEAGPDAPMRPGHPGRLQDCPNCRNLGYLNTNCHYVSTSNRYENASRPNL